MRRSAWRLNLKRTKKTIQWSALLLFGSTLFFVILYRFTPVYITPLMLIRCAQQITNGEKIRLKHHWVKLEDISEYLPVAVIASEDQHFMEHHGFNLITIQQIVDKHKTDNPLKNASTISQQTAKNVFLWHGHTWIGKGLEVYFTILIELFWNKHRIMEVYLNSIEMGDGIYGAEAVAQQHFGRTARLLTKTNCALIAATLPNPRKYNSKSPSRYILKRQTAILRQMRHIPPFEQSNHIPQP